MWIVLRYGSGPFSLIRRGGDTFSSWFDLGRKFKLLVVLLNYFTVIKVELIIVCHDWTVRCNALSDEHPVEGIFVMER